MHAKGWQQRILVMLGVGVVTGISMWSAGIPTRHWFPWLVDETQSSSSPHAPASILPVMAATQDEIRRQPRLHLVSTAPGRNAFEGTAAIGVEVANPQTLSAGALLANGTILKEIYTDHVILERAGRRTELFVEGVAINARAKPVLANDDLVALDQPVQFAKPARQAPSTFAEILRGAPHYDDRQLLGFDIYPGTNSGQFSQLGLRAGDLLLAIDGAAMDSQEVLSAALKDISEGRSVVASVIRGGQRMDVSVDGSALHQRQTVSDLAAPQ